MVKQTDITLTQFTRNALPKKLKTVNIDGNLYSWLSSYLLGRKQRIASPAAASLTLSVTSSVP